MLSPQAFQFLEELSVCDDLDTNNLLFTGDAQTARAPVSVASGSTTLNSNFVPYYNINAITITEAFSPLIKFDFQFVKQGWSANLETKRDKSTSLNISGLQIIETKGQEYVVGLGYMYPKLKFQNLKIQGKVLESNLMLKLDVSYRQNLSVIRRVSDGISVPTGGTNIITLRSSADYQLTQNINLRLFYDWIRTKPQTSASFPTANATGTGETRRSPTVMLMLKELSAVGMGDIATPDPKGKRVTQDALPTFRKRPNKRPRRSRNR